MSDSTKRNASEKEPPQMLAYDGVGRIAGRGMLASPIRHFLFFFSLFIFIFYFFYRLLFLIEFLPVSFIKERN